MHRTRPAPCEDSRTRLAGGALPDDSERSGYYSLRWNGAAVDHARRRRLDVAINSWRTALVHSDGAACCIVLGLAAALLVVGCAGPTTTARHTPTVSPGPFVVGPNVDVSNTTFSQDEVSAVVDPNDPAVLLAGSNSLQADNSVRVYSSADAGQHWTSSLLPLPPSVTTPGAVDQWVAIGPHSEQAMSYMAFGRPPQQGPDGIDGLTLFVATRSGPNAAWQAPATPVDGVPSAGMTDDKDTLAFDNSSHSPYQGRLYVAWDRDLGNGSTALLVSHSTDGGHSWSSAQTLLQQGANWGAALTIAPDGALTVAWAGDTHLWIAQSRDGGEHFSTPTAFGGCTAPMSDCLSGVNIPAQSDAGIRANPVLVAIPASGQHSAEVLALYADGNGSHTQIYLARFDQTTTLRLSGTPAPVPVGTPDDDGFLPGAAYDMSDSELWVCAYVAPVKAPSTAQYTCTASADVGLHFLPATPAATVASNEEQPGAFRNFIGRQYGDYTAVVAANGVAHVFWTDSRRLQTLGEEIYTATLTLHLTGTAAVGT